MTIRYRNLLSRLLLRKGFENQFAFPILDGRGTNRVFEGLERLWPAVQPAPPARPIFLVCLPRTGSTWLQTLLCLHPDLGFFTHLMHQFPGAIRASSLLARLLRLDAAGERFIRDSVATGLHGPSEGLGLWGDWFGQDPACLGYEEIHARDLGEAARADMYRTIAAAMSRFGPDRRFFCKNPAFIPVAPLLAELFPKATFIHLVRDPRATANSMLKLLARCDEQLARIKASGAPMAMRLDRFIPYPRLPRLAEYVQRFGAGDIRTTARLWRDAAVFMDEHREGLGRVMTVRFESLLADPLGVVNAITDFCGLRRLDPEHPAFAALCARTGQVEHVNDYGGFGEIAAICREAMIPLGYDPAG